MAKRIAKPREPLRSVEKCPTGIEGLDDITGGGLPRERTTLVCGGPGCGKTILGMQFLFNGAEHHQEPGLFISFEQSVGNVERDFASLEFDWQDLVTRKKMGLTSVRLDRSQVVESGDYNLDGLFARLAHAVDAIGAKRIVLDAPESLFGYFDKEWLVRSELIRLLEWLQAKGLTAVITGEGGKDSLSRYDFEEFVVDCVVTLDQRVFDQTTTRRMRVIKYRGSSHSLDEIPFLIDNRGISVIPISSTGLDYQVSTDRVSTGVERLDTMLGGEGYFRGSSVLVSGTAGTGKTTLAAYFADAACRRGEKVLFLAFEESGSQIVRNMRSIAMDLEPWTKKGLLQFNTIRPTHCGLELHLAIIYKLIDDFDPHVLVLDPMSNLTSVGRTWEVKALFIRLIGLLKQRNITGLFTNLNYSGGRAEQAEMGVSSLMDTWIVLQGIESDGEVNRTLKIVKSRGMEHSNQLREFVLTRSGVDLLDVYLGDGKWVMGTARAGEEARKHAEDVERARNIESRRRQVEQEREDVKAQIAVLEAQLESKEEEFGRWLQQEDTRSRVEQTERHKRGKIRGADS